MAEWADFPWNERMFLSADEAILSKAVASVENGYQNAAGGHSRYPGLTSFATGLGGTATYVFQKLDNLIAVTDQGRTFRIGQDGSVVDCTGVPVSGGQRVIFDATDDGRVVMAAGGPIIQLQGEKTTILSPNAPNSTHVAFIEGYLIAIETGTGRFNYSDPGAYTTWNPLSVFTADAKADPVVAVVVTPYTELMVAGTEHIEQYELLANGNQPFTRRWSTGQGVRYPYTLLADWTGTYGINSRFEFVRFYGQISQDQGSDINQVLQNVDDWTGAWTGEISVSGQKHIMLQAPNASNIYGTKGITLMLDYQIRKWSFLYGWDATLQRPTGFPAQSITRAWGKVYVGVPGGVALVDGTNYTVLGKPYPFLIRSAHVSKWGPSRIDEVRLRLKRGLGPIGVSPSALPQISLRVNRDNEGFDQPEFEDLGQPGERTMTIRFGGQGIADTWQFEIAVTDNVPVEITNMQVFVERMRW